MALGRNRCVIGDMTSKKVMPYKEFVNRVRKTLYYGPKTSDLCMEAAVSRPLAEYASELFSEPHKGYSLNRLTEEVAGRISAHPCALIMALIYLDRLNVTDSGYVRRITPLELFVVSLVISTKFFWEIDEKENLQLCAEETNMTEKRIKELELQFLFAIDWNVFVSEEEFFKKLITVETTVARREGIKRGWLTYTELLNLLPPLTIVKLLLNNIAVMAVSYAASVMTIAGAFFLVSHVNTYTMSQRSTETQLQPTTEVLNTTSAHVADPLDISRLQLDDSSQSNVSTNSADIEKTLDELEHKYAEESRTAGITNSQDNRALMIFNNEKLNANSPIDVDFAPNCYTFAEKDHCDDIRNGTKSIFWNLLRDGEKAFTQFPFLWFKFI